MIGRIVLGQKSDRHHLHAIFLRRNDLLAVGRQLRADPQHLRNIRTVDIAVEQADAAAALGECHRQVHGHGGFPDTALSRANGDDVLDARQRGTTRLRGRRRPHFRGQLHVHIADSGHGADHGRGLFTKLLFDGARRRRQFDREGRRAHSQSVRSLTKPSVTMSRRISGSTTARKRVQHRVAVGLG